MGSGPICVEKDTNGRDIGRAVGGVGVSSFVEEKAAAPPSVPAVKFGGSESAASPLINISCRFCLSAFGFLPMRLPVI